MVLEHLKDISEGNTYTAGVKIIHSAREKIMKYDDSSKVKTLLSLKYKPFMNSEKQTCFSLMVILDFL